MRYAIACFVVVLLGALQATAETPSLVDPSFEQDDKASPSHWRLSLEAGAEGKISWATEAKTGRRALRVEKTNGLGFLMLSCNGTISAQPETSYESVAHIQVQEHGFGTRFYFCNQDLKADQKAIPPIHFSPHHLQPLVISRPGTWHRHTCRWTTGKQTAAVRLQLVLTGNPAVVVLDDLELVANPQPDVHRGQGGTSEKPYDDQTARATLAKRRAEPARVETMGSRPMFVVGDAIRTALVHQGAYGHPRNSRYGGFGRSGIHLQTITVQMGPNPSLPNTAWKYPQACDFTQLEQDLLHAVAADPEIRVILQVRCDMPAAWCAEHPEDVWTGEDGLKWVLPRGDCHPDHKAATLREGESFVASYGSPAYRDAMAGALQEVGQFVATSEVGKLVVGFVIGGGNDGQFFDWSRGHELDHSEGHRRGFQAWLREVYDNDLAALRQAWGDPQVTFETAAVCREAERAVAGPFLASRGPQRRAADSNRYAGIAPAQLVKHFAKTLKVSIGRPVFSMCYYPDAVHDGSTNVYALSELLAGADRMDSATAVQEYGAWRQVGGTGGTNACWGSYRLRGAVQVCEIDYRTYRSGAGGAWGMAALGAPETAEGFRAQIRRDLGATASRGMGAWYYDMSGGWYDDPDLWAVVEESRQMMDWAHRPEAPSPVAEMAVFVDEEAGWRVGMHSYSLTFAATNPQRKPLNLSGVPYDLYLLDDIRHPDLPDYKAYVFLSAFTLNDQQLAAINERCRRPGKLIVFPGTPGLADGDPAEAAERATAIAGIACELLKPGTPIASLPVADCSDPIAQGLAGSFIADGKADRYVLTPTDPAAIVFGRFVQAGKPSYVIRRTDRGAVILMAAGLTPELVHNLAREAGIATRGTPGQVTYVGSGVAVCHRVQPGKATVQFAQPVDLVALDGKTVLARGVTQWEPHAELLETDVVLYRQTR